MFIGLYNILINSPALGFGIIGSIIFMIIIVLIEGNGMD